MTVTLRKASDASVREELAVELTGIDLDEAVAGYLECQLWTGFDMLGPDNDQIPEHVEGVDRSEHGEMLDEFYGTEDIDPEYVAEVREELREFVIAHPLAVRLYLGNRAMRQVYGGSSLFGHDFLLTRDGHGTGFWDRGLGELGEYLTRMVRPYGESSMLTDGALCSMEGKTFEAGVLYA